MIRRRRSYGRAHARRTGKLSIKSKRRLRRNSDRRYRAYISGKRRSP